MQFFSVNNSNYFSYLQAVYIFYMEKTAKSYKLY